MRTVGVVVMALTLSQESSPPAATPEAETAIRAIVAEQVRAWNAGAAKGMRADLRET